MSKQKGLGGGFKHVFFTPTWGNDPFDKHIFSNGLPNHQLEDGDQSNGKLPLQTFRPFNRGEKWLITPIGNDRLGFTYLVGKFPIVEFVEGISRKMDFFPQPSWKLKFKNQLPKTAIFSGWSHQNATPP